MTTPTTDVAVRPNPAPAAPPRTPVNVGVPLKGLDEAFRLSQALAMAGLLPAGLRGKPSDVLAVILYGAELGIGPLQATQGIYVVQGRPVVSAQTWLALLRMRGHRAKVIENTEQSCTVELQRGDTGEIHRETFTMDDAKKAKLASKDVWQSFPRRMLLARAVANAARFLAPEVILGMAAEGEVFEDERPMLAVTQVIPPVVAAPEETLAQVQAIAAELGSEGWQKTPETEPDVVWEEA